MMTEENKKFGCSTNFNNIGESKCMPHVKQEDLFLSLLTIDENGNVYGPKPFGNIIGWYINGPNKRIRGKIYDSEIRFNCNIQRIPPGRDNKTLKYSVINGNYE